MVGVHHEKALVHPGRQVVILFDCYRLFCLHDLSLATFLFFSLAAHEELVHLRLFFSSILHGLEVSGKRGGTTCTYSSGEGNGLNVGGRNVIHVLDLTLEV